MDGGRIPQAGLRRRRYQPPDEQAAGLLLRGVVVRTWFGDDAEVLGQIAPPQVLCDVLLYRGGWLFRVPVAQEGASVTNGSLWVPQACSANLVPGSPLRVESQAGERPVPIDDLDGERVLVGFIDASPTRPVILKALAHPRSARIHLREPATPPAQDAAGTWPAAPAGNERFLAHQGTVVRVDHFGNVVVDTSGAGIANDGETDEAAARDVLDAGRLDINLRSAAALVVRVAGVPLLRLRVRAEDGKVELDLGESASERAVLGDRFAALFDRHRHTTWYGETGPVSPATSIETAQADEATAVLTDQVRLPGTVEDDGADS